MSQPEPTPNDLGSERSLWQRATGGLRRRVSRAWRTVRGRRSQAMALEAAWEWLQANDSAARPAAQPGTPALHGERDLEKLQVAIEALMRRQRSDGAVEAETPPATMAATWELLAACRQQVQVTFDELADALPRQIDPDDGRMQAVADWLDCWAAPDCRVADIGCGSGRFLDRLVERTSPPRFLAVDPSPAMLARVPAGVPRVAGSLLSLPLADGTCHGVFCVEALEHSLLPQVAVAELCRVTRSGGRILIIDKHARFQPLSEHLPWERWFTPEEVCGWLVPDCREVDVRAISHGKTDAGLFLCWTAVRS